MDDKAIAAYKKAIEINPEYVKAYNGLAIAYYLKGEHRLFIKYRDRAIEFEGGQ